MAIFDGLGVIMGYTVSRLLLIQTAVQTVVKMNVRNNTQMGGCIHLSAPQLDEWHHDETCSGRRVSLDLSLVIVGFIQSG